jgi:hypothetical protein
VNASGKGGGLEIHVSIVHYYPCLVSDTSLPANEKAKGGFKLEFKNTNTKSGKNKIKI